MKELWIAEYDDLYWHAKDHLGMSDEDAHRYADGKIDDAYADRMGDLIDQARQRHKDEML